MLGRVIIAVNGNSFRRTMAISMPSTRATTSLIPSSFYGPFITALEVNPRRHANRDARVRISFTHRLDSLGTVQDWGILL